MPQDKLPQPFREHLQAALPELFLIRADRLFYAPANASFHRARLSCRERAKFEGILGILAGTVALAWPGITALAFLYLLAAWAILTGIMEVTAPLSFPMSGGRAVLTVLTGVVSIIFGILIASQPSSGLLAVVWLIGVYAFVFGVMYIVVYFQSRSLTAGLA